MAISRLLASVFILPFLGRWCLRALIFLCGFRAALWKKLCRMSSPCATSLYKFKNYTMEYL